MHSEIDGLKWFIETIKSLSFFQRLFAWKQVRNQLIDAAAGISSLNNKLNNLQLDKNNLQVQLASCTEHNKNLTTHNNHLQLELATIKEKLATIEKECRSAKEECLLLRQDDEYRRAGHSQAMATLQSIKEQIQQERRTELEERNNAEIERIRNLKETWYNHQA